MRPEGKKVARTENEEQTVVAIGWYEPGQWERLREVSADAKEMPANYQDWLAMASNTFAELVSLGFKVRIMVVDVDELLKWCQERGLPVNAESRSKFVTEEASRRAEPSGP